MDRQLQRKGSACGQKGATQSPALRDGTVLTWFFFPARNTLSVSYVYVADKVTAKEGTKAIVELYRYHQRFCAIETSSLLSGPAVNSVCYEASNVQVVAPSQAAGAGVTWAFCLARGRGDMRKELREGGGRIEEDRKEERRNERPHHR
jgi:hypothetical protein